MDTKQGTDSIQHGYENMKILKNYKTRHGCNTMHKISIKFIQIYKS